MKSFLTAGFALATCAAFAAMTENFTNMAEGKVSGEVGAVNWATGTVAAETETDRGNVLVFDGTVSCTNDPDAVSSEFVKTSFDVLAPSEGMSTQDLPPAADLTGCQIAIAAGDEVSSGSSNLKVMIYHGGTNSGWAETGLTVTKDRWFEVTLHFDYTAKKAKVEIGGAVSELFDLVTVPANEATASKINSLSFVGSSKIDNVSIQEAVAQGTLPDNLKGFTVYTTDLNVTTADLTSSQTYAGGLTVAQQIQAGITPKSETTSFVAKGLSTVTENNVVNTVITVPCNNDNGQVYQVTITKNDGTAISGSPVSATAGVIKENNTRDLTFTVPTTTEKVLKFNVVAKAPGSSH